MKINQLFSLLAVLLVLNISYSTAQKASNDKYPEEKLLGIKLGSQAYTFRLFTFAEALDKIDSCGLRYVEIFPGQVVGAGSTEKVGANLSPEGRKKMKELAKQKNITIHAFGVVGANDAQEWDSVFRFAKDMGVKVINVEPADEHLHIVSALCDKYKIFAALHNHPTPSKYWDPEVVLRSLRGRSPYMGAGADVGHWMRSGLDPVVCLRKLDGRILHLHFKDLNVFDDKNAHDVHWGTGVLPIKGILEELKRQEFDGMLSAEYEYNWSSNKDDVRQSVKNLRNIILTDQK